MRKVAGYLGGELMMRGPKLIMLWFKRIWTMWRRESPMKQNNLHTKSRSIFDAGGESPMKRTKILSAASPSDLKEQAQLQYASFWNC